MHFGKEMLISEQFAPHFPWDTVCFGMAFFGLFSSVPCQPLSQLEKKSVKATASLP